MRDKLEAAIQKAGMKHWSFALRKDPEFIAWMNSVTIDMADDTTFSERVYAAVTDTRPVCERGGKRSLKSIQDGWRNCGPARSCECARQAVSDAMKAATGAMTSDEKAAAHAKRTITNLEKYGVANIGQTESALLSRQATYADPSRVAKAVEKGRQTMLERHGVDNAFKLEKVAAIRPTIAASLPAEVKERAAALRRTNAAAGGLLNKSYEKLVVRYLSLGFQFLTPRSEYTGVSDQIHYRFRCLRCEHPFNDYIDNGHDPTCPSCDAKPASQSTSGEEISLADYVESLGAFVIRNSKKTLRGVELDIWMPDRMMAIEYSGLYWHSEISNGKGKFYHYDKMKLCEKHGIRLVTMFSDEWLSKRSICEDRIKHIVGLATDTCYARKTEVGSITHKEARDFIDRHHIQGDAVGAKINLGLKLDGVIVGVMTFGALRGGIHNSRGGDDQWELYRFAMDRNIVGGASKLFSHFVKNFQPQKVISYCDRRWGSGDVYRKMGFAGTGETKPGYWWVEKHLIRHHRANFQKRYLVEQGFDPNKSETEIMYERGFDRIWDCGNLVFTWESP